MAGDLSGIGRVWLVGRGNLGGALLARWTNAGLDVAVVDTRVGVPAETPDVIVLAVKPQVWRTAVAPLAGRIGAGCIVVSVMAGITTTALSAQFPDAAIVRTIPNTPSRIGHGVTPMFAVAADGRERRSATALFAAVGTAEWLDDEADFDAATAVSGSGPAYVFAMIEALATAGESAGLAPDLAARLALGTVTGAAALAAEGGASPEALRIAVTSPNGTTAAGLAVLQPGLGPLLWETVAAAQSRSRDLGRLG